MILLIDIGNTAIKWGTSDHDSVLLLGRERYREVLPETVILTSWQTLSTPKTILISNVAGHAIADQIKLLIKKCWDVEPIFIVENQPLEKTKPLVTRGILGTDRWLALFGISQMENSAFAVIGCGTAITLDICENSVHLGGLIAPGVELMRLALETYTAGCRLNPSGHDTDALLAFDTDGATRSGTLRMAATFIESTLEEVEKHFNLQLKIFITGGDADRLMPFFEHPSRFIEVPAVVLEGLALFDE